jgi:hypothetical protein
VSGWGGQDQGAIGQLLLGPPGVEGFDQVMDAAVMLEI